MDAGAEYQRLKSNGGYVKAKPEIKFAKAENQTEIKRSKKNMEKLIQNLNDKSRPEYHIANVVAFVIPAAGIVTAIFVPLILILRLIGVAV